MDVVNLSIKQLHTRASSCMVSSHISARVCKTYVSGNTVAMFSYWNNLNLSVLVYLVFFYLTQSYLVSRHVCAIHMSMEIHLQCFPIETTSLFRSVDIWCCHTRSYLVPRHGCAIHMSMEIHLRCFPIDTISLFRSTHIWCYHIRSYLVPRHQCYLLPPTRHTSVCILSIYWLPSTLLLVISTDLLSTGHVLPLLGI